MQQYILQSLIGTNFLLFFFFRIWLKQKLLAQEAQEDKPIENLPDNCIGLFHSARGQLYSCRWCNTVTPLASGSTHIYI